MYYMIMLIISNLESSFTVLDTWEENGVPGVTILEGTGLGGVRQLHDWEGLSFMPSLLDFVRGREQQNRIFMTVVEGEAMVDHVIHITQTVIGDLRFRVLRADSRRLHTLQVERVPPAPVSPAG